MAKAQVHNGYKSAVFSKDESGCFHLDGFLKKKNSHGVWQKRWFYLNNEFLIYKKDKKSADKDIKGVIDISEVSDVKISPRGDVEVIMKGEGGARLFLKGADEEEASNWQQHIFQRLDWLHHESELQELAERYEEEMAKDKGEESDKVKRADSITDVQYSGWLKKKSPKKYIGLQDRFVKIENNFLRYYKTEADSKNTSAALGGVSLETVDWVRPYDKTADCSTLEVQAGERVFLFVAESPASMKAWVEQLTLAKDSAKAALEKKASAKLAAATPYRIRIYDDKSPAALEALVREDIEDIFPMNPKEGCTEEEEVEFETLEKKLSMARDVVDYLEDMLPEVQKVPTGNLKRPARLDVLAVAMIEINKFLTLRLTPLVDPSVMDTSNITLGDLHGIIGWLTYYKLVLSDIYCPPVKAGDASPSTFPLFQLIPDLCQWYVEGVPGTTCEGAAKHIKGHVLKIFENFVANPAEMLQRHTDGTFFTHAPTDIWELLHHHLSLATSTSSPVLSFLVASAIVEELNVIIRKTTAFVMQMHQPDSSDAPSNYREVELELLCALSNDIALHFEQVQTVIEKFNIEEIRNKVDNLFDAASDKLIACGQACLRRLSTLVMEDMSENMQEIFTVAWLGDAHPDAPPTEPSEQINVALATISDYLADLNEFLVPFWSSRLVDFLMEVLVTKYFKLVMKIRNETPPPATTDVEEPTSPKAPNKRGLLSQMSSKVISSARDLTKVVVDKVADSVTKGMRASEASVALIENDTAAIEDFFSDKTSNAGEYIKLLADLAELLIAEPDDLSRLLMSRINQCPPAAQAILESATRCAELRDDLTKDELDMIFLPLEPMLEVHSGADGSEVTAVSSENRLLCGLYCDLGLTQKKSLTEALLGYRGGKKSSTRKILESSSTLAYEKQQSIQEEEEDDDDHLEDVLGALENVEEEYLTQVAAEEEAEIKKEEEEQRALEAGRAAINFEGLLGKKSPAHNMWQDRWFKLMTRVEEDENGEFQNHHTLLWYKKKGGSVIKSLNTLTISGMQLVSSPRALAYREDNFRIYLEHDPEGEGGIEVKQWRTEDDKESKYVFSLHLDSQSSGKGKDKDMILKAKTVDLMLQWMNHFAVAAKLEYDMSTGVWVKGKRIRKNRRVAKRPQSMRLTKVEVVNDISQKRSVEHEDVIAEKDEESVNEFFSQSSPVGMVSGSRALHMEGEMEKKSPAHNLWQSRYFKLMTKQRESDSGEMSNIYNLMWYKKKGGSVIKTLSSESIAGLMVMSSPTSMVYSPQDHTLHKGDAGISSAIPIKLKDGTNDGHHYTFLLQCKAGAGGSGGGDKDIVLRVDSTAKLIAWVNCLAEAANLGYSESNQMWLPGGRVSLDDSGVEVIKSTDNAIEKENNDDMTDTVTRQRVIFVDGELEKKSPAHNMWQTRYFKLSTRQASEGNIYTLMWFKKKDSSVLKSVSAEAISGLTLISCSRPIVYSQRDHCLHPSDLNDPNLVGALFVKESNNEPSTYSFIVHCKAGAGGSGGGDKDVTLRTDSVDKLVLWMNSLAEAADLEYNEETGEWTRGPRLSVVVSNPKAMVRIASLSVDRKEENDDPEVEEKDELVNEDQKLSPSPVSQDEEHVFNDEEYVPLQEQYESREEVSNEVEEDTEMTDYLTTERLTEGKDELPEHINPEGDVSDDKVIESDSSDDGVVQNDSSDSEVDATELDGVGNTLTALDFDRRESDSSLTPEKTLQVETVSNDKVDNHNDTDANGAISSPLHAKSTEVGDVVAPVFDMSVLESREKDGKKEDTSDIVSVNSDEDIKEYRMSDCDDEQKLKPAGCSGCVVM